MLKKHTLAWAGLAEGGAPGRRVSPVTPVSNVGHIASHGSVWWRRARTRSGSSVSGAVQECTRERGICLLLAIMKNTDVQPVDSADIGRLISRLEQFGPQTAQVSGERFGGHYSCLGAKYMEHCQLN